MASKSAGSKDAQQQPQKPHLSANFAHPQSHQIDYDHEVYLHLMAGGDEKNKTKTPNQVYREVGAMIFHFFFFFFSMLRVHAREGLV